MVIYSGADYTHTDTTNYVWYTWTSDTCDATSSSTSTAVWGVWNSDYSTTATISDTVWVQWNIDGTYQYNYNVVNIGRADPLTPEQIAEQEERARQREEARQLEEQEKARAELVAQELLLDLIGERELRVYKETGRLFVKGRKHDYIIWRDKKVQRIEKDKVHDLCVHLEGAYSFPASDNVIALKLHIEHDEEGFNRKAHRVRSYDRPAVLPLAANG